MLDELKKYCEDVLSGKIVSCQQIKNSCFRFLNDLNRTDIFFNETKARKTIYFIQLLKHSKGKWAGTNLILEPWQKFIVANLFGWYFPNGKRRFRTAYLEVARKNGKSTLLSGIGNYLFIADGEQGAEIYTAATKKEQAAQVHKESIRMIKAEPNLLNFVQVYKNTMTIDATNSIYSPLSADNGTLDGLNVHGALIDEFHAHKTADLYNVLRSAMGSRENPITIIITTAGFSRRSPCYIEREYAEGVASGRIKDDNYFSMIFTLDKEDDWHDEKNWVKANPNMEIALYLDDMRDMAKKAIENPTEQNNFLTKKLNIWCDSVESWISTNSWMKCKHEFDMELLKGKPCWCGMDLSSSIDLTALVLVFPPNDIYNKYVIKAFMFMPSDNIATRSREDKVPYDQWNQNGDVLATAGNVIDLEYIKEFIIHINNDYPIKELAYDKWNAIEMTAWLQNEGVNCIEYKQYLKAMSPGSKLFEKMVLSGEVIHNNACLDWMAETVSIYQDINGNIKPVKPDRLKSNKRIDGIIASIMALDRAVQSCYVPEPAKSVYETRGLTSL